jgi:hypothetical protein
MKFSTSIFVFNNKKLKLFIIMNIGKINTSDKISLQKLRRDRMFGIFGMKSSGVWKGVINL